MPDPNPDLAGLGAKKEWLEIYNALYPQPTKEWPEGTHATIDKAKITEFLQKLEFPLYFFDYETMQALIPYFDGHRPYQQVPFQYSIHILDSPGSELRHIEYLHSEPTDPAPAIAEHLVRDLGTAGSIIVWNQSFEKSRNVELGTMYPQYRDALTAINERVVDLMVPFKSKWYDDPRFEGSASIKNVLPVLCPELSYKELGIQEGNSAQRLWMEAVLDEKHPDDKEQILADLSKYCGLDTLAMVKIYQVLEKHG